MKNEQWSKFSLPGSHPWHEQNSLLFGNESGRVLGPKEKKIYDNYRRYCWHLGCEAASEERWRMESQRIPNV